MIKRIYLSSLILLLGVGHISARVVSLFERTVQSRGTLQRPVRSGVYRQDPDAAVAAVGFIQAGIDSISVPFPDGRVLNFSLTETETLDAGSAAAPIRTFSGRNGNMELRLTLSVLGMTGMVDDAGRQIYFGPANPADPEWLLSYEASGERAAQQARCGVAAPDDVPTAGKAAVAGGDNLLRRYTIAIAATGEYTTWAGSVTAAQALITTTINNVNLRYERDFNVHFNLTAPASVIYPNAGTDPFTTVSFPSTTTLNEANNALNTNIGSANYNVGMVFGYGWSGGLAQIGGLCTTNKGRSAGGLNSSFSTGSSGPVMDDLVAHEIGHQFNATHTMAANNGSCSGNVTPSSGVEPGGGSTIMAYAGSCSGNSYQTNPDHYFHAYSISQVMSFIQLGTGATCASATASGNASPVISVPAASYSIPNSTPFMLAATATDADAGDVLTYTWEQMNPIGGTTGTAAPPSPTATSGPNFRSFPPAVYPQRYFPRLEVLAGKASGTYEVLPTVARTMNFRTTVRDNHSGAGRTAYDDVAVVTQNCGPFSITNLTAPATLSANGTNTMTLTWNPATACVTMPGINVRFSTDGGLSFPYLILANTPNDGTETFTVPNYNTCNGRFMIESIGNVFFNVSNADIAVASACGAKGATFSPATPVSAAAGSSTLNLSAAPDYGSAYALPLTGSITTTDAAGFLSFFDQNTGACSGPSNAINYDTLVIYPNASGNYTFTFSPSAGGKVMSVYEQSYAPTAPCTNFLASSAVLATGGTGVSLNSSVTAALCADKRYILLISSFGNGTPALPSSYTVSVTAPAGGAIYNGISAPAGYSYCYAIVQNTTGLVVDVQSSPDLTNASRYGAGSYRVYGISSAAGCAALASRFNGSSFSAMRTAVQNQDAGLCAQLSANARAVTVNSNPLSLRLLSFEAGINPAGDADLRWSISRQQPLESFTLERSLDGRSFNPIAVIRGDTVAAAAYEAYNYEDPEFEGLPAGPVHYRLRIQAVGAQPVYSPVEQLRKAAPAEAMQVAPNPLHDGPLNIGLTASRAGVCVVDLTDPAGRSLFHTEFTVAPGANQRTLLLPDLPAGVYLVRATFNGKSFQNKLVRY